MKNKNQCVKYLLVIIGIFLLTFLMEKGYMLLYRNSDISRAFSWDRSVIFFLFSSFVGLHFIIPANKIWDFIYRKRYIIGITLFVIIVANGYHGSSVYQYNSVIEPSYSIDDNAPFIGTSKAIRSDEFLVDTPGILSQINYNSDFETVNDAIMAREGTTVYMFPQLPTKSISVLSNPKMLGFLFLPTEQAFSFYWYILFFVCFFATFETCMLITKEKRIYSLLGACLLTFSPAFLWWNQLSIFASGFSAIIFTHLFFKSDKIWKKLVYSLLFGYAGCVYIMTLYPGWLLPFGYMFLGLFIWVLFDNRDKLKWIYLLYFIPAVLVLLLILLPGFIGSKNTMELMSQTVYPGARITTGGYGENLLFNYLIAPFYTLFKTMGNPCEAGQFIGLYPLPIFIGLYLSYKNFKIKNNDLLLNILILLALLLSIWNYFDLPIFAKITLLTISTPDRAQLVVNAICILIIIRIISCYSVKEVSVKKLTLAICLAIVFVGYGLYTVRATYPEYVTMRVIIVSSLFFILICSLFIINNKKYNSILSACLILISVFNLATVQPISKGLGVMDDKPIAKAVSEIISKDKKAKWLVVDSGPTTIFGQNYLLANGARVVNSTNYYPNFELWKKFDPSGEYDEVYNRYAHIAVDINTEKTDFELLQGDLFKVKVSINDLEKFDAKYYVSPNNLNVYNNDDYHFEELYRKDNIGIYILIND